MDINKAFKLELHRKIIKFFHENQACIDTPRGIATWIGEDRNKAQKALEDLVLLRILVVHRSTSTNGYSYTRDEKLISKIDKLLR
ncbi:MAG: hypothetical protein HZA72_03135 [Candidatus Omnitrophica bacterium]|nr:hypothetical protein [Candidatus Omnitrophota bacterium]